MTAAPRTALETRAARDVVAERLRQIREEGFAPERDDAHTDASLVDAAICYCYAACDRVMATARWEAFDASGAPALRDRLARIPIGWPRSWPAAAWKPKDRRRDLVRAAALIIAEIERLDRAAAKEAGR